MIIANIILLVLSFLVMVGLFFGKFSQLSLPRDNRVRISGGIQVPQHESLWPYFRKKIGSLTRRIWHFILEAKDLMPATTKTIHNQTEKFKSVFRIRIRGSEADPHWLPEAAELTVKPVAPQSQEEFYLNAIRKNPSDTSAFEALGRLYLQNKNYADAIEIYEYLTKSDPQKDSYYSNLGLAHYSLGDYSKAISSYERALSINNKIPTRWINLSLCFDALEDHGRTVKTILHALQFDKLNTNYLTMLADTYLKIPNNIRAEEVLEQILSLEPTNKSAREKLMRLKI